MLQRHASAVGWALWYLIRREPTRELVGVAGFKGRLADGSCEIGYSLLPSFHGSGYATEASRELIRWAFSHRDVERATGETLTARSDRLNTRDGEVRNAVHWRREPRRGATHRPLRCGSRRVPPIADVPKQLLIISPNSIARPLRACSGHCRASDRPDTSVSRSRRFEYSGLR